MQIKQERIDLRTLAQRGTLGIDQTIGLAVANHSVYLMSCILPPTITEKMAAQIPSWQIPKSDPLTFIKSIQIKNGLLMLETVGPLTTPVKTAVDIILNQLITTGRMVTVFFPVGGNNERENRHYQGYVSDKLRNVPGEVNMIRFMEDDEALLFTQRDSARLCKLPLAQINNDWTGEVVLELPKRIEFLGGVQVGKMDIVLNDGTVLQSTIEKHALPVFKRSPLITERQITAIFGTIVVAGNTFLAAIRGQELILVPATSK